MATKITITIAPTPEEALAAQRHTDWLIRQEQGRNRNGRDAIGHRVHGAGKTKKGQNRRACRGKVPQDG
jgi:hypothetical protein